MPSRPHLPHHLSLRRVKSSGSHPSLATGSLPTTPSEDHSRNASPNRASTYPQNPKSPADQRGGDHKHNMGLVLRVLVIKGRDLAPKDRSGTSNPLLILTLGEAKQATSVVSRTLNPEWNQSFDLPILSPDSALLEAICWDKDRFKKDYMGEFDVVLEDIFSHGNVSPEPRWFKLESRRAGRRKKKDENVRGEVLLKFSLFDPLHVNASATQMLSKFAGVVVSGGEEEEEDDGEDDDEEYFSKVSSRELDNVGEEDHEKEPSDETDDGTRTPNGITEDKQTKQRRRRLRRLRRKSKRKAYEFSGMSDVAGVLYLEINRITDLPPERNVTKTSFDMDPFVVTSLGKKTYRTRVVNHNLNPIYDEKLVFQVQRHETNFSLNFAVVDRDKFSGNDFVGTASFPLEKVRALAPEADPETGLYRIPDPDGIAEGERERRKRFRMPISRSSSQNNVPKISSYNSQSNLTKLTKSTSNSNLQNVGNNALSHVQSESAVDSNRGTPVHYTNPNTGVVTHEEHDAAGDETGMYAYELPLEMKNKQRWEGKYHPVLYIRARYLPYRALRQQFWRAMLRQYDADESGKIEKIELVTMLDSLGSTLHNSTINGFFRRWRAVNGDDEFLTFDQAVICLEAQLMKSQEVHQQMHTPHWHSKLTHHHHHHQQQPKNPNFSSLPNSSPEESPGGGTPYLGAFELYPANLQAQVSAIPALEVSYFSENDKDLSPRPGDDDEEAGLNEDSEGKEEHVVEIQECPICHQPRLSRGRRANDADIITHIATCASSDWRAVNNLVMAGFVTSSQARRKWYSKVITKVSILFPPLIVIF